MMAFARICLIVHYPTDVIVGLLVGTLGGVTGALLSKLIYKKARGKFGNFLKNASIVTLIKNLTNKRKKKPDAALEEIEATEENTTETELETTENTAPAEEEAVISNTDIQREA